MRKINRIGILVLTLCLLTACVLPVYAQDVKTLCFEEHNGKMNWNNIRGSDGNWFMSFINMVPGGEYTDRLRIENGSKKTYKLYMQVIPLQQDQKKDELLELIFMEVSLGSEELYRGTASGKNYDNGNLQDVMYIGTYEPGKKEEITVNLQLDKKIGLEYCNLLTKIDWKFMVTEVTSPDKDDINSSKPVNLPKPVNPPKTGDDTNIRAYILIMLSSLGVIFWLKRKKRV